MKKISYLLAFSLATTMIYSCGSNNNKESENKEAQVANQKIVSLNGAITEIICNLGHEKELVGRDVTSTYPESMANSVKDLGHVRSLTIEPIVALNPTLIVASDKDINADLLGKIKESGIKYDLFEQKYSIEGTKALIKQVAQALGNNNYQSLWDKIDADIAKLQPISQKPKVLFIYARGAGTLMVAGKNTPMESIIQIAGGVNAVENLEDFKPLTPEALIQGDPDLILLFDSGLESLGGTEGLLKVPGIAQTKAGKNKAIISMEGGLLSGFGPRVGEAAVELNKLMIEIAK